MGLEETQNRKIKDLEAEVNLKKNIISNLQIENRHITKNARQFKKNVNKLINGLKEIK